MSMGTGSENPEKTIGWFTLPVVVLILANLVPVYFVVFYGWQIFSVILFFWLENVIIGMFNVLKMLFSEPGSIAKWLAKCFIIPFFCVHYGMFTAVHGIFVFVMFGGSSFAGPSTVLHSLREQSIFYPALALIVSHGFSFFWNYLGKGEYRTASLPLLMFGPYGRVIVLHITILFGGFLVMVLRSPVSGLLLLVFLKIILDIKAHLAERKKYGAKVAAEAVLGA